jgi:hypothetical protein
MSNIRNLKTVTPDLEEIVFSQIFINGEEKDVFKLNGVTYFRTNDSPTITYVTKTTTSITFKLTNNNISPRRIFYEIGDSTPDLAYVDLEANEQSSNIVISGLTAGTSYTLYTWAYFSEEVVYSSVTSYAFTTLQPPTTNPSISDVTKTYVKPNYIVAWRVYNNDASAATIYTDIGDSTPDVSYGSCASGNFISANLTVSALDFPVTIYAKAQATGKTASSVVSYQVLID